MNANLPVWRRISQPWRVARVCSGYTMLRPCAMRWPYGMLWRNNRMGRKYFGTDGVRGRVGEAPITPDWVLRLAYAFGRVLADERPGERPGVLIGKDTRISGYMLEAALESGFSAAGVDVYLS